MYWFKRKWRQIKRVWNYLPIIWRGYDWDYRYAIELFQHQLKRTADYIERDGNSVDRKMQAAKIRTAVRLLEKVYDEDYAYEYAKIIEEKYGPHTFEFVKSAEAELHGKDNVYEMIEVYERDYTETEKSDISFERDELMVESRNKQKRAHRLVWQYIEHNILYWWD